MATEPARAPAPQPNSTPAPAPPRRAASPPAPRLRAVALRADQPAVRLPSGGVAPAGRPAQVKFAQAARDPRFQQALRRLDTSAARAGSHPPAAKKAADAQAAALPPANERLAGAKAGSVEAMQAAETGKPENTSFLDMLRVEIQKVMPKKTEDADEFMQGDDKNRLKGAMTGNISQQKAQATGAVHAAATTPPDPSRVPGKEVTPLPDDRPPAPTPIDAGSAMPAPQPPAAVSLQQGKQDADSAIKNAELTTPQLQKANDPRFSAVLTAKAEVDTKADSLPQQFRVGEQRTIADAVAKAQVDERKGVGALAGQQQHSGAAVHARQLTAKQKDEQERKKVADTIEQYYAETKQAVDKKLESLDKEVERVFDAGTETAIQKMKDYVETRFDDRYSGISGKALWLKDKIRPLPAKVKVWFDEAHAFFLAEMDALVVRVANLVETRLREAKDEIRKGERRIADYVKGLPANLQAVGKAAQQEMSGRFAELRRGVDDKKADLAEKLAQRYKDAYEKGATALQDLKDAHKSLIEKLKEFVEKVVKVLREFKDRIVSMLKKSGDTLSLIVSDPIGFLGNLLSAIKQGISQFVDRIWVHLKEGFMEWLFGSLAEAGITVPKDFSLPAIFQMVLAVLGLTYDKIRAKVAKQIGERNVGLIERAAVLLKELVTGGPARLWEMVRESFANLKEMLTGEILTWLIGEIIKAAVTKLISMFNPVGAIIQAILMIYRTVMFFIERINQILDFVQAIIESVSKIAHGDIGGAANWIEQALARAVPLIIAFLARLLGISGITDRIKRIIHKLQTKVDQAIDKVVETVIGMVRGAGQAIKGALGIGAQPGAAAPNQPRAGEIDVDQDVTIGTEHHTLRVQIIPPRAHILMASNGFGDFRDRVRRLETRYRTIFAANPASSHLAQLLTTEIAELLKEADTLEKQAEAVKPPSGPTPTNIEALQRVYQNALKTGLHSLEQKLAALGEHFKFGGGQAAIVGDPIILKGVGSSPARAAIVAQVGSVIRQGNDYHFGILVRAASSNVTIPRLYSEYGTTWEIPTSVPPVAPAAPFYQSGNVRTIITGLPLNPAPTSPSGIPPGWTGANTKYSDRGHLVANRFYGPNNVASGNIVAMTQTANLSGMKTIENTVATRITTTGNVYRYEAEPLPTGKHPPDEVEIRITKIYPPPADPPVTFPRVKNT